MGRVRLAASPSASATLVPRALARIGADSPGIDVALTDAEPPEALGAAAQIAAEALFAMLDSSPVDARTPVERVRAFGRSWFQLVGGARAQLNAFPLKYRAISSWVGFPFTLTAPRAHR